MKEIPNYHPPADYRRPTKTQEKVYVPVNDYPEINFSTPKNPTRFHFCHGVTGRLLRRFFSLCPCTLSTRRRCFVLCLLSFDNY